MTEEAQEQQVQDGRIQNEDELYKKLYYLRCLKKEQSKQMNDAIVSWLKLMPGTSQTKKHAACRLLT